MADVEGLHWVTEQQEAWLSGEWGDEWPVYLRDWLASVWPEWEQAGDEDRQQWLDSQVPVADGGAEAGAGVADLSWVRPEQVAQLNELWEVRGDWREWLPVELDGRWAEWRWSTPEELAPWLDGLLPGLVLPPEAADIVDNIISPAMAELYAQLPQLAYELGITVDELTAEMNALPEEFFVDIVLERIGGRQ